MRLITKSKSSTIQSFQQVQAAVVISQSDLEKYRTLIDTVAPDEVQWYSTVRKSATLDAKNNETWVYVVEGMYIPKQEVTAVEADTKVSEDPMTMLCIYNELKTKYKDDSPLGYDQAAINDTIKRMHVWCHSHPFSDDPVPSATDKTTFHSWIASNAAQSVASPVLMLIFGKTEQVYAEIYDPELPRSVFMKVPVAVKSEIQIDTSYIDDAVANKITKKPTYASKYSLTKRKGAGYTYTPSSNPRSSSLPSAEKAQPSFFNKKHSDFDKTVSFINTNYQCEEEVGHLWEMLSSYLPSSYEQTIFISALTCNTKEFIESMNIVNQMVLTKDECLACLTAYIAYASVNAKDMKQALTFTKRYINQKSDEAKNKSIAVQAEILKCNNQPLPSELDDQYFTYGFSGPESSV